MRYRAIKAQPVQAVSGDSVPLLHQIQHISAGVCALAISLQLLASRWASS
jgi:hypothetical protein